MSSIYLNLGLISVYTHSYREYLLSSRLSSLHGALYKPSEILGLVQIPLTLC